jgi:predicted nucleic acid-binding protein
MYLIDTDLISELRKGRRCNPRVSLWYKRIRDDELFLSVLVIGEIRQGIERLRTRNPHQARVLEQWLDELIEGFGERIVPVDQRVAQTWGRLTARGSFPVIDALLAATAEAHGLTLVTRNVKDVQRSGARCLNPFEFVE